MATAIILNIDRDYTISENGEYYFYNSGTYEIKIFGSSGNGCEESEHTFSIPIIGDVKAGIGGGGGGGAFGYFRINMTGNDAENNKVKITYNNNNNNDFIVEIKSRNPENEEVWQVKYNVTAGKDGQDLLSDNGLKTAAGGTISLNSSSNLENAEFLEWAFNSAGTNGQDATGNELNLSFIGLGTGNYSIYGGKGGSYTASNGKSYEGFSGGNGIVNTVIPGIDQSASDGQKGKIIITRVSNSNPGTGTEGGSGTTPNPDPETPGDSTTTPNILTKKSIQELKVAVNNEIKRRCYYGNISSAAVNLSLNNENITLASDINEEIINPLNLIADKITEEIQNNPIKLTYINAELDRVGIKNYPETNETTKNASHGCNTMCTGFCSDKCSNLCSGGNCGSKCGDSCGNSCESYCDRKGYSGTNGSCSGCSSTCESRCGNGCSACGNKCSDVCQGDATANCTNCGGSCAGDSGQGQCGGGCSGDCGDTCDDGCAGDCSGTCTGGTEKVTYGCSSSCSGKCYILCGNGCGNNCTHNCAQSCSGSSYST